MKKLGKLEDKKRTMNLNDGIYCYYKDNVFNPISNESIEVYYNRKTYYFKSFEEMISYSSYYW